MSRKYMGQGKKTTKQENGNRKMRKRKIELRLLGILLAAGLVLGGCGRKGEEGAVSLEMETSWETENSTDMETLAKEGLENAADENAQGTEKNQEKAEYKRHRRGISQGFGNRRKRSRKSKAGRNWKRQGVRYAKGS